MNCEEFRATLDACIDGELGEAGARASREHEASCGPCRALAARRRALVESVARHAEYAGAPPGLAGDIRRSVMNTDRGGLGERRRAPAWAWLALAASVVLAATTAWLAVPGSFARSGLEHEAVSAHIRSLMAMHLADVPSSDQHTVKPWFAGRIDFSPPVVDLAAQGFPLSGGRLDYFDDRPVAALVYARRAHAINLFVWPDRPFPGTRSRADRGFNWVEWSDGSMRFVAVSDLNGAELSEFARLLRQAAEGSAR